MKLEFAEDVEDEYNMLTDQEATAYAQVDDEGTQRLGLCATQKVTYPLTDRERISVLEGKD
jgi:hypothetical protein